MNKSITQDMAYKSRSYIYFWKQRWDGSAAIPGLSVQAASQPSKPAYGSKTETHPGHAPQKSNPGHDWTPASSAVRIPRAMTAKSSAAIARTGNASISAIPSILWTISQSSLLSTIAVPTTCP